MRDAGIEWSSNGKLGWTNARDFAKGGFLSRHIWIFAPFAILSRGPILGLRPVLSGKFGGKRSEKPLGRASVGRCAQLGLKRFLWGLGDGLFWRIIYENGGNTSSRKSPADRIGVSMESSLTPFTFAQIEELITMGRVDRIFFSYLGRLI